MSRPKQVAILISGGGSNMVSLVEAMECPDLPAEPCVVMSNTNAAGGIAKADDFGIPTKVIDHRNFADRESFEDQLHQSLLDHGAEFICLAGFMRILTASFVSKWEGRMLNTHPSILPLFTGLNTHQRAIDAGMAVHGVTVHQVTAELDAGPILGQAVVPILKDDTAQSLAARALIQEHKLYPEVLRRVMREEHLPVSLFPAET